METVTSADGTSIAYAEQGAGPVLIVVDGAMATPDGGRKPQQAALLAEHFTVRTFFRRGRGNSGDTPPYSPDRELDDIEALIDLGGQPAYLYGHSSGGCLALDAAARFGTKLAKVAVYEVPYNDDPGFRPTWTAYLEQLHLALNQNRRGDAVTLFLALIGAPLPQIVAMRQKPVWPGLEAAVPTLAHDHGGIMGPDPAIPADRVAQIAIPLLAMYGTHSPPFMGQTAGTLSRTVARGELRAVDGQAHDIDPAVLAPILTAFFLGG
jgi:pimeloyl-ACP methyl ester carboxylesterase